MKWYTSLFFLRWNRATNINSVSSSCVISIHGLTDFATVTLTNLYVTELLGSLDAHLINWKLTSYLIKLSNSLSSPKT
jgi:hypothetical protein